MAHLARLSVRLGIKVKIGDEERAYFLNWIEEEGQAFSFGENQVVPGRFIRTIRWKLPKEAARFDDSDPMEHTQFAERGEHGRKPDLQNIREISGFRINCGGQGAQHGNAASDAGIRFISGRHVF